MFMAAATVQESSSSSFRFAYHVFLSLGGKDTRKRFADHLYGALVRAGIHTFRHHDQNQIGENVLLQIRKAIHGSKISMVVLSKEYASSTRCLDELVMIMEAKRTSDEQHIVLPVFYHVLPSQVREQTGSYGDAFAEHEECYKEDKDRVNKWRAALRGIADLEEKILESSYEAQLIRNVVKRISSKLHRTVLYTAPYLVNIETRIADVNSWLQDGSSNVGIATIYGTGGIGKTTTAKVVYNQNFDKFQGSSFLANIRQISEQPKGLVRLQRQLLSDILKEKANKIYSVDEGLVRIKHVLCCRKVLLVLDDVDEQNQFNAIIGMQKWVSPGSKIIVTTRHKNLLRTNEVSKMFKIEGLDDDKSLKLFSWHAFDQDHPIKGYSVISRNVVHHCGGLPLAIQVLGSSLSGRSLQVWESALQKLKAIPDCKIQDTLRISYDSIEDAHDKNIFLDIACFFTWMDKDYVVSILDGCNFHSIVGINNLIDRCLITINEDDKITMHRLLRDMGREIIRQEALDHPGKRSRLWNYKDAFTVLCNKTGTESIRGFNLNLAMQGKDKVAGTFSTDSASMLSQQEHPSKRCRLGISSHPPASLSYTMEDLYLETEGFAKMHSLMLLRLYDVVLHGSYEDIPKHLVWLYWHGFPLKSIPNIFHLEKLVVLDMRHSNLTNVWKRQKILVKLKILNLSQSHSLISTPDFTGLPSLEKMILKDCTNLVHVDESIGNLQRLVLLNLRGCKKLKKLPENISSLESLKELNLSGCSSLDQLSKERGKTFAPREFQADGSFIDKLHSAGETNSSDFLSSKYWRSVFWKVASQVKAPIPVKSGFSLAILPQSLVTLKLADCNLRDGAIPNDLQFLPSLETFDLSGNLIDSIPEGINKLNNLKKLTLNRCPLLQEIPELPNSLQDLRTHECSSLERIRNLPNLLTSLSVETYECDKLAEVQGLFKLEPARSTCTEILSNFGLFNLESLGNIELELGNVLSDTRRKIPLQVLHECGIFSIFLPGNEIPTWFSYRSEGCTLSFDLPYNRKISGLNLCAVYTISNNDQDIGQSHYAKINNKSRGTKWTYSPTFYGIPDANKDIMWLSHWRFGEQMECGDRITFYAAMSRGFQVKKCGVHVIFQDQASSSRSNDEDIEQQSRTVLDQYQNLGTNQNLSVYEVGPSAHFLCNHWYLIHQDVAKSGWDGQYEYLFEEISEEELNEAHLLEQELESSTFMDDVPEQELAQEQVVESHGFSSYSD